MAGIELDPRTGEPRGGMPFAVRICILLLLGLGAVAVLLLKFNSGAGDVNTRELAYRSTGLLAGAEWEYKNSHGNFATMEELQQAGLIDYPVRSGTADIETGITASITLPMDRQNFRIDVTYPKGHYMTTADNPDAFHDFEKELKNNPQP